MANSLIHPLKVEEILENPETPDHIRDLIKLLSDKVKLESREGERNVEKLVDALEQIVFQLENMKMKEPPKRKWRFIVERDMNGSISHIVVEEE